MDNFIRSEIVSGVQHIQLTRLDKKNALTASMYQHLIALFNQAEQNQQIRCVFIYGDANCFTAGNDLHDFLQADLENLTALKFVKALAQFNKPIVAAVAGIAVGIGTTLLLHCDMAFAAPNTLFKMPFVQLGLCPEAGSSVLLTQRLGYNRAFELMVLGESFSSEQALAYGLINQMVDAEQLLEQAQLCAEKIAALPQQAVQASRYLLRQHQQNLVDEAIEREGEQFLTLLQTQDCKNILQKFLTK